MLSTSGHLDHRITLRVEGDRVDVRPVPRVARPARRVRVTGLHVQRVPGRQDGLIVARMALLRADVADAAVRWSTLYQRTNSAAQLRASYRLAKPLAGNSGRYLAVRNSDSA